MFLGMYVYSCTFSKFALQWGKRAEWRPFGDTVGSQLAYNILKHVCLFGYLATVCWLSTLNGVQSNGACTTDESGPPCKEVVMTYFKGFLYNGALRVWRGILEIKTDKRNFYLRHPNIYQRRYFQSYKFAFIFLFPPTYIHTYIHTRT
jgi:hypothetical protein